MDNSCPLSPRCSKVTQRGMVDGDLDLGSALLCASFENNKVQLVEKSTDQLSKNPTVDHTIEPEHERERYRLQRQINCLSKHSPPTLDRTSSVLHVLRPDYTKPLKTAELRSPKHHSIHQQRPPPQKCASSLNPPYFRTTHHLISQPADQTSSSSSL